MEKTQGAGQKEINFEMTKEDRKEYKKKWYKEHREERLAHKKQYYEQNKDKILVYWKKYREQNKDKEIQRAKAWQETHKEQWYEIERKHSFKRRSLGFVPLNQPFEGSDAHHICRTFVIYIPKELHQSIRHSVLKQKNMEQINQLAWKYLQGGNF